MKERLTITLDKDLLSAIDATIDGVNIRNRSHAIEHLLNSAMSRSSHKKAVIFAGGSQVLINGKEFDVPMVMIKGKPIIDYILAELKRNKIYDVIISIGRNSEKIPAHLGGGADYGQRISYVREDAARGTEGALELVENLVGHEPFFAFNGDHIFTIDMEDMYRQHIANRALATIALTPANSRSRFGVTKLEGNRITSFVQSHGRESGATLVNAGIYIFDPEIFRLMKRGDGRVMLEESLFPKLAGMDKLFGYVFSDPWYSIDSTSSIQKSIKALEGIAGSVESA
jgi:mannose-1-phosphate guanylyltransferase